MRCEANCESMYLPGLTPGWMLLDAFVSTLDENRLSAFVTLVYGLTFRALSDWPEEMLPILEVVLSVPDSRFLCVPSWCCIWKGKLWSENQLMIVELICIVKCILWNSLMSKTDMLLKLSLNIYNSKSEI